MSEFGFFLLVCIYKVIRVKSEYEKMRTRTNSEFRHSPFFT